MLRTLIGKSRRKDEGPIAEANRAIRDYLALLDAIPVEESNPQERRYNIWGRGFLRSLDELEESQYAAAFFGGRVTSAYTDEMQEEERDDYNRHLYFYKNAIIRLFAILDKMGHFMNERFRLKTEQIKSRFSYFTVLRNMHENKLYVEVEEKLYAIKMKYKEPVDRLRNERNLEIHTINADLLDDLLRAAESSREQSQRIRTENIAEHLNDLAVGCDMVFAAVEILFSYLLQLAESSGQPSSSAAN